MSRIFLSVFVLLTVLCGCNSGIEDVIDVLDGVPRKTIDTRGLGVNAFVNDSRFGSIENQFLEVRDVLRLRSVRVLMSWNDDIQRSPNAPINYGFYDEIINNVPSGVDVLVILTGVPSWMNDPDQWIGGNPRRTFVEKWVKPTVSRYRSRRAIVGWEVWNEPNIPTVPDNSTIQVLSSPSNFVELVRLASQSIRSIDPGALVVSGATTAINQDFPDSLNYNRELRDNAMDRYIDVWGVHYYGRQYENVVVSGGVADFLNGISRPVWITESGEQGVNNQLPYGEQAWPFLKEKIDRLERIYIYQFTEATPADVTYGLRNLTSGASVSDLYIHLRDRK